MVHRTRTRETSNLPPEPAAVVCNHVQTSGRPLTMVVIVNARRDDIPLCLRYPSHERQITVNTNAIALRVAWIRVGMHAVSKKYCTANPVRKY